MAYYGTEELWFPEWEHGGTPLGEPGRATSKHNPVDHVERLEDADAGRPRRPGLPHPGRRRASPPSPRCSAAASRAEFLYFPDENHWVLKPPNSILWHDTVERWLKKWTGP